MGKPTRAQIATQRGYTAELAKAKVDQQVPKVFPHREPTTLEQYNLMRRMWREYNEFARPENPKDYGFGPGERITYSDLCNFIEWYARGSVGLIKNQVTLGTIVSHLKHFKSEENRNGNETITREIIRKVKEWVKTELTLTWEVPTDTRDKWHVNSLEFFSILKFLWMEDNDYTMEPITRLQLSLFMMISAFTLGRPGTIVLSKLRKKATEAVCYQDLDLRIVLPEHEGAKCIFLLGVKLRNHKGQRDNDGLWTELVLHDSDVVRPVSQFIVLALRDGAFEADIKSPADLLRIAPLKEYKKRSYQFRWKKEVLQKPLFCKANGDFWNTTYVRNLLRDVGLRLGFQYPLTLYSIRYGVSNSMEAKTTADRRQQIMAHIDKERWSMSYMSKIIPVDLQGIFTETQTKFIGEEIFKRTGHCEYMDSRAPQEADPALIVKALKEDQVLQELENIKERLQDIQLSDSDTPTADIYTVRRQINNRKQHIRRNVFKQQRNDFFSTIDTRDINDQIQGQVCDQGNPAVASDANIWGAERSKVIALMRSNFDGPSIDPGYIEALDKYINDPSWEERADFYKTSVRREKNKLMKRALDDQHGALVAGPEASSHHRNARPGKKRKVSSNGKDSSAPEVTPAISEPVEINQDQTPIPNFRPKNICAFKPVRDRLLSGYMSQEVLNNHKTAAKKVYQDVLAAQGISRKWSKIPHEVKAQASVALTKAVKDPSYLSRAEEDWLSGTFLEYAHYTARQKARDQRKAAWKREAAEILQGESA
ncbi:hypothetical protein TWF706_010343 [Orbilia oligospora]|nr:hypothetical protein TWF706_010343 [Orbilia oligospora]